MADTKCPMCSASNPAEAETCQKCGARLKPLTAPLDPIHPGDQPSKISTSELEQTLPTWLREARQAAQETSPAPEPATSPSQPPADFLAGLSAMQDDSDDEPLPDWMAGLRDNLPAAEETATSSTPAQDLLASLIPAPASAEPTPEPEKNEPTWEFHDSESAETPDWLAALKTQESESQPAAVTPQPEENAQPNGDLPDWLSQLSAESPIAAPPEPAAPAEEILPSVENSNWLDALRESPAEAPAAQPATDLPDWMATLGAENPPEASAEAPDEQKPPQAFATGSLSEILSPENADETPAWLAGISAANQPPAADQTPAPPPEAAPTVSAEPAADAVFSMDMPDWLAGFTPGDLNMPPESAARPISAETPAPEDISPASLPSWVQALRPVEAVIAEAEDDNFEQTVEKTGPLAGFRAVLPVSAGLLKIQRPKTYSIKLDVDNTQQQQVALLESLLTAETRARQIPARQKNRAERPLRWLIAVILLLAAFLPLTLNSRWTQTPSLAGTDLSDFANTLAGMENNAPALVVVDYQPAFAGELEPLAYSALRELMKKQARLAFVSTSPTGALLAERLMARLDSQNSYPARVQLGYLPGGAAGIQVFASDPTLIGRGALNGSPWESATLTGVTRLQDFALTLVLTDSPDEGRLWVEQAAPELRGKPMLMILSAQAEPLLRPYFDSHQVQGLLVGLNSGAVFEAQFLNDGPVRQVWDSFNLGLIAMEALIVAGGLWGLAAAWLEKRAAQQEEA